MLTWPSETKPSLHRTTCCRQHLSASLDKTTGCCQTPEHIFTIKQIMGAQQLLDYWGIRRDARSAPPPWHNEANISHLAKKLIRLHQLWHRSLSQAKLMRKCGSGSTASDRNKLWMSCIFVKTRNPVENDTYSCPDEKYESTLSNYHQKGKMFLKSLFHFICRILKSTRN